MSAAFVAGATGYTGREVVRALVARGVRTVAHVRPDSSAVERLRREFTGEGAEFDATPWDEARLTQTLSSGFARTWCSACSERRVRVYVRRHVPALRSYATVDYGLTAMRFRATVECQRNGGSPRFVYVSALGAGQPSRNPCYDARFKLETELRASGLSYVIARPAFITGPDRAESRPGERGSAPEPSTGRSASRAFWAATGFEIASLQ